MKRSRSLIIGGSGFLGSHLCEELVSTGHPVTVVSPPGVPLQNLATVLDQVRLIHATLDELPAIEAAWEDVDTVYHLACTTRPKSSNDDPAADIQDNLVGAVRMLDRCVQSRVRRVIFPSSGGTVYGHPRQVPIPEDHPTQPLCSYGIHKLAIEKYLQLYHHLHGLDYRVARIANAYGERQAVQGDQGLVAAVIERLIVNRPVTVWGDGTAVRDYLHARDIAAALRCLARVSSEDRVFNVGSGTGLTVLEVITAVERALGRSARIEWLPARALDAGSNVLDITRITRTTGWQPRIGIGGGIARCVSFINKTTAAVA
jgi:UDP-glucose 4-epimerase